MDFNVNEIKSVEDILKERINLNTYKIYLWNQISVKCNPDGSLKNYKILSKNFDNCEIRPVSYSTDKNQKEISVCGFSEDLNKTFVQDSINIYYGDYSSGFKLMSVEEIQNQINKRVENLKVNTRRYEDELKVAASALKSFEEDIYKALEKINTKYPDYKEIDIFAKEMLRKKYWG